MKLAIFSLLFFAAIAAQAQQPTTLKAEPSAMAQKTQPIYRLYYYVEKKGVENVEVYNAQLVPDKQLGRSVYEVLILEEGKLKKKVFDSAVVSGLYYIDNAKK